MVFQNVDVKS